MDDPGVVADQVKIIRHGRSLQVKVTGRSGKIHHCPGKGLHRHREREKKV